jgi:hypothetical protein
LTRRQRRHHQVSDGGRHRRLHPPSTANPLRNRNGTVRLAAGQLTVLVLDHMRTYQRRDFSPYELAKVLGRSHGTIRRTLLRLAETGTVVRTRQRPARFRIAT